ncbi:MAG: hypothetical protein HEP71_03320 [Roseivirga sp.]|nr:hypothetical protein [Roseivirga sp.]
MKKKEEPSLSREQAEIIFGISDLIETVGLGKDQNGSFVELGIKGTISDSRIGKLNEFLNQISLSNPKFSDRTKLTDFVASFESLLDLYPTEFRAEETYPMIQPGAAVKNLYELSGRGGTISAIAKNSDKTYLMSCSHVLKGERENEFESDIITYSTFRSVTLNDQKIGAVVQNGISAGLDIALAEIDPEFLEYTSSKIFNTDIVPGPVSPPKLGYGIMKYGRVTKCTNGYIYLTDMYFRDSKLKMFQVNPLNDTGVIASNGDSGSLVLSAAPSDYLSVLGVIFRQDRNIKNGIRYTSAVCIPMSSILEYFNINI